MTQAVTAPGLVRINRTPVFVCACYTALTLLDPPAAVLLLARLKLGVMRTVANISSDVALNAWAGPTCGVSSGHLYCTGSVLHFSFDDVVTRVAPMSFLGAIRGRQSYGIFSCHGGIGGVCCVVVENLQRSLAEEGIADMNRHVSLPAHECLNTINHTI